MSLTHDRRVYGRAPFFATVGFSAPPGGPALEVHTFDISLGGVGLVCPESVQIERGSPVLVRFRLPGPKQTVKEEVVYGKIAWAHSDGDGRQVGVEFLEPIHPTSNPGMSRLIERL